MAEIERSLVQRGFAFVSVNYRLAPKYKWPDQIDDATASIRFLKANAAKLGINPLAVSVVGDSAGGALASLVGVTGGDTHPEPVFDEGPFVKESSRVRAVVDMFGPVDRSYYAMKWGERHGAKPTPAFGVLTARLVQSASAVSYVRPGDPCFLIIQGLQDTVDPPELSLEMYDRLREDGDRARIILIHHSTHEFIPKGGTLQPSTAQIVRDIVTFLVRNGVPQPHPRRIVRVDRLSITANG